MTLLLIFRCVNGHMECRVCFDMTPQCGKCKGKIVDVPAKFAEFITEQFNVQCSYAEKGCTESVAYKVIKALFLSTHSRKNLRMIHCNLFSK